MSRPVVLVLAGVNGAGKSSIGGRVLEQAGTTWFNPDTFARELVALGWDQVEANVEAWNEGVRRLDAAVAAGTSYAFETTLGGNTVRARIAKAARTHAVHVWFCGLASPDLHIARVRARVAEGGHDIPEHKIRERYRSSVQNLIELLPSIAHLQVYDNSAEVAVGSPVPDPVRVAEWRDGRLVHPTQEPSSLTATPDWAKPIVEAALSMSVRSDT